MIIGLIGISMPVFWLGEVVNLLSQSRLHDTFLFSWVPPLGYTPLTGAAGRVVQVVAPPWLTLSVLYIGIYARVLRSSLVEAQEEDGMFAPPGRKGDQRSLRVWDEATCSGPR